MSAPEYGVKMTLGLRKIASARSGGAIREASIAAPPRWPARKAASRAARSRTSPRAKFKRQAPGFIRAISAAPIRFSVPGPPGTCRTR